MQKCCTVPKFFGCSLKTLKNLKPILQNLQGLPSLKVLPKKPKKPILQNLQGLPSLKVLENRFFRFFRDSTALFNTRPKNLGTVQHFCSSGLQKCCTVPKFLVPGPKNSGTVQHFCSSGLQKCCTVRKFFGFSLKSAVLWRIGFFRFFRDSTALFNPRPKKLGTVQHFCSSGLQKCCTVPKFLVPGPKNSGTVQHFCSSGLQKCCTVPKFLVPGPKKLGTVQHFCSSGLQKCCTVPKFFGFSLKSAVLSLKNLKPILQNLQGLPSLKVLENRFF